MKVLKFGGTSVGSVERIKNVATLVSDGKPKIVVLSAMSGVTNSLVEISELLAKNDLERANEQINALKQKHLDVVEALFCTTSYKEKAIAQIHEIFLLIKPSVNTIDMPEHEKVILAQGELLSTAIFSLYLQEQSKKAAMLSALDFMKTDSNGEPDFKFIETNLRSILEKHQGYEIYVTQGYICRNVYGEIDNLQRGGSDYTASLIGAAVRAEEIQIWTDISGIHNNDPRFVKETAPIKIMNFDEAAELAYFGAKILHPTCILPAKLRNIPVRLLNSLKPEDEGSLISNDSVPGTIKAIAAKDNITAIKIKSERMLMAYGFLRKVFEVFELYKTPIDMITTSEVGVSLTIDQTTYLSEILGDLEKYGTVSVDKNMVIICVVGDLHWENVGLEAQVIGALKNIPLRMVSYGGSNNNITVLVKAEHKQAALDILSGYLFNSKKKNK